MAPCDGRVLKTVLFDRYRIEVPVVSYEDKHYLHVSCHVYSDEDDIDRLIQALATIFPGK